VTRVDVHQHLWPEQLLAALASRDRPPRLRGALLELAGEGTFEVDLAAHDPARRIAQLDRDEIDVAVISLQPTIEIEDEPELVAAYHEGIAEIVAGSRGRLTALGAEELRDGFAGASVSARALVEGRDALFAALEGQGGFLFVHPGPPAEPPHGAPDWWPSVVDYTAQMQAAYAWWLARGAERHARLRVVFAILAGGAPVQLERLAARGSPLGVPERTYVDTASYGRRTIELCLAICGPARVVFGSDAPVVDPRITLDAIRELGDAAADAILGENAADLLP
jgi:predicted TIM-barrel fold metal-dependent hydrolase